MNNTATHATAVISGIARRTHEARTAARSGQDSTALTAAIDELVTLARSADLPADSIDAALAGHRAAALSALDLHTYEVITVEDGHGARYYEIRSVDDAERVAGFYNPDVARDAVRILNTGMCPASLLPASEPLR